MALCPNVAPVSQWVSEWVSQSVSEWQGHLLSCSGQLKSEGIICSLFTFRKRWKLCIFHSYFSRKKSEKNSVCHSISAISSYIFDKSVRSWKRKSTLNHIFRLDFGRKKLVKNLVSRDLSKFLEKFHFLILISSHYHFTFTSLKRVKAKYFHFALLKKEWKPQLFTSRIKVKAFFSLFTSRTL